VEKLSTRFAKNGFAGLLTEEEENKARQSRPSVMCIATYNLHGIHDGNDLRFRYIARELSAFEPDVVAFQEAINGNGIRETSAQVAQKMSAMIGAHYRTFYSQCHLYRETYPEGVAVCARFAFTNPQTIDLNEKLRGGLKPTMPRYASTFQIQIREKIVAVASTHLDHGSSSDVRAAQAEKLVLEMEKLYPHVDIYIIAGDMNDVEDSLTLEQFRSKGYFDAYRGCQPRGGNTFTADHPHTRIDFILIKGSVKLVSARTILADPRCSDHLGVLVTCI
jgi:endonuclease/exonuclease/phosphatase family metal-dependent hydrolase